MSELEDMPEMIPAVATCHTPECANGEMPIEIILAGPQGLVFCGVCTSQIADVKVTSTRE